MDFEFLSYLLLGSQSLLLYHDISLFQVVVFLQTINMGHQNLCIIPSRNKIPRKYSTASSRTRFMSASYPFNTPVTIPLSEQQNPQTFTSSLELDSNSLILILLEINNELLLGLRIKIGEKGITMRYE